MNEVGKTQTVIKTNQLSLTFNGTSEINAEGIIPGDSFTKTFTVENTSSVKTFYNIYMEGITNEFNEDLVYVLTDGDGEVVAETPLPTTNAGKTYLFENIEIEPSEIKEYTLTIEYKYLDTPQNDYQGAEFKATVGIDTNKLQSAEPVALKYYAFGLPTTASITDYNELMTTENVDTFIQLEGEQLSICTYTNENLECFKNNAYEEEIEHAKNIFGENKCSVIQISTSETSLSCMNDIYDLRIDENGYVDCYNKTSNIICKIYSDNTVSCERIGG